MDLSARPDPCDARAALGAAISDRADDVANRVLAGRLSDGRLDAYSRDHPEDILLACRHSTEQVGRWLATGQVASRQENEQIAASAESAAAGARPLAGLTKNYLSWRDTVLAAAQEEAARLQTPDAILVELAAAVRQASDASLVRMARRFDVVRAELEAQVRADREQLDYLALHDSLTGLANRTLLMAQLTTALAGLARGGSVTVLFIDIDRFKSVNDRLGHAAGDSLLVAMADRLRSHARASDTVARLGGDEFVIVCPGLPNGRVAQQSLVTRLLATAAEPVDLGEPVRITLSVGTACGREGSTPDQVLAEADAAMYATKRRGRLASVPTLPSGHAERLAR